jgi:uncharacterized hydantoinase/oxoprolinase family protein
VIQPQTTSDVEYLHGQVKEQFKTCQTEDFSTCLRKLKELIPVDAASRGIQTEVEVIEQRDVAKGICQAAERFGADAICLATHGRTGLASVVAGSVATSLLARAARPLFLVRVIKN